MFERALQAVGSGVVAYYESDFNSWEFFVCDSVDEGLQVAAAAREKDGET
jgi:hypothetical protein